MATQVKVACTGGGIWELLPSCAVSLGKIKAARLTYVVSSIGNQIIRGGLHHCDIIQFQILNVHSHFQSEDVLCLRHHNGEKGWRQEARGMKIQCHHLTIWTLLEIAGIYITRTK